MKISFEKYQGTGNDFVMIDNRNLFFPSKNKTLIEKMCDRKFGIGADGLILIQKHRKADFEMLYFNADGKEGSMCGNGGRCAVAFAASLKLISNETSFMAVDGMHKAIVKKNLVYLKMIDVNGIEKIGNDFFVNTGSPHYVRFVLDLNALDVVQEGKKIRNNKRFKKLGTNVNFVQFKKNNLVVRTYERGVEDETLSCGTGVTAAAIIAAYQSNNKALGKYKIETLGGSLSVKLTKKSSECYSDIWLQGPAQLVFKGTFSI